MVFQNSGKKGNYPLRAVELWESWNSKSISQNLTQFRFSSVLRKGKAPIALYMPRNFHEVPSRAVGLGNVLAVPRGPKSTSGVVKVETLEQF
ncbi:hypothetical protein VNO77_23833 [Canavalia gladiata]|uniref:Uncharacterized protein n=1 Tax=Canavalia gladiata TaxID=3824 RepID=A0AAN9Q9B1_CANGL